MSAFLTAQLLLLARNAIQPDGHTLRVRLFTARNQEPESNADFVEASYAGYEPIVNPQLAITSFNPGPLFVSAECTYSFSGDDVLQSAFVAGYWVTIQAPEGAEKVLFVGDFDSPKELSKGLPPVSGFINFVFEDD